MDGAAGTTTPRGGSAPLAAKVSASARVAKDLKRAFGKPETRRSQSAHL